MGKPKISLYLDIVSPFAYLAYYMTRTSPVFQQCEITYIPILLGGVFKSTGNVTPLDINNKKVWINTERQRWARLFKIPIGDTPPDGFPIRTLGIQRALAAISTTYPSDLVPVIDACYKAFWAERNVSKIEKPENFLELLKGVLGEEKATEIAEKSTGDEAKRALNKYSDEALHEGCFGVPFWVATNTNGEKESFWGFDHMGQVLHFLGLETPKPTGGWQAML